MKQKSIFTTFFSVFLLVILISIGASAIYSITTFNKFIYQIEKDELIEKTEILRSLLPESDVLEIAAMEKFTRSGKDRLTRITIIDSEGVVLSDSIKDYKLMNNHYNRPEIKSCLDGEPRIVKRFSDTLSQRMIYYALPIVKSGKTIGFIRTSISVEQFNYRVKVVYITIIIISIVIILLSIAICYILAMKFSETINSVKRVANHYSRGKFNYTLTEDGTKEIVSLSKAINNMGELLQKRIFTISKQKNRYKSMLESMTEPVIRLDSLFIIEEMNSSAENLFNRHNLNVKGMSLLELTMNTELYDFAEKTLKGDTIQEAMISFGKDLEYILQVHGSVLYDAEKNKLGVLLVMNDMTELVRLEVMRKEFVANVSHELRTPITTIQGYVETLMSNEVSGDQLKKFLGILSSNTKRIKNIIEDLLVLAGLEKGNATFKFEHFPASDLISSAVNAALPRAEKQSVKLVVRENKDLLIYAHPVLADQALTNLIVNAVQYSEEGSSVYIESGVKDGLLVIEVIDSGCGISDLDQRHLFERFYRVDKARSRDQGGTGLGLSIVKRIMGIHGGEAQLSSTLGEGSTFRLVFPIK